MKFYQKYLELMQEMPKISLRGKSVYADEEPLKGLPTVKVEKNIVIVRQPTSGAFVPEGWTLVYFMDTEEAAQDFRDNKIPYLIVPRGTFYGGGSPITDIWKKKFQQSGHEHILGMIEANTMEDVIFIDMMTVRKAYQRQGITSHMINFLKGIFPNAELRYSSQTDAGKKFATKYAEKTKVAEPNKKNKGKVKGTIKYNSTTGEYIAKIWLNGRHEENSDYFTDDKEDASNTLKNHMIPYWVSQGYEE